jgi:uncharacterized caspase-like protein
MKRKLFTGILVLATVYLQAQTIEATSTVSFISIGKWKNANADVDKNIPEAKEKNNNIIALIIGNEDYSSYQTGLQTEVNVDYAENDARVFKDYLVKTLGADESKVDLRINATLTQMKQGLSKLMKLAEISDGQAEIYFYYSGHGLPDENTKDGYLIPVDVSGAEVTSGIKIDDLYAKLTEFPVARITVLLDACFSGGARNQGLVALKGVKITSKAAKLEGNMVVFTSSSGQESSAVYRDKGHGYFTYFFLKALQDSKGDITYKKMFDYVKKNVSEKTVLIDNKTQTPQALAAVSLGDRWQEWRFKP